MPGPESRHQSRPTAPGAPAARRHGDGGWTEPAIHSWWWLKTLILSLLKEVVFINLFIHYLLLLFITIISIIFLI